MPEKKAKRKAQKQARQQAKGTEGAKRAKGAEHPAEGPPGLTSDGCPKCNRPAREGEPACARCGLLRERWATYDPRPAPHAVVDPLWELALADWQNDKRHAALAAAVSADWRGLSALAQRYAGVLRERPKDPIAVSAMDHLIQVAARLPLPREQRKETLVSAGIKITLALGTMMAAAYLMFMLFHH